MESQPSQTSVIPYKRSRFQTRLPTDRVYTPSHFWLLETGPGAYRVGFTRFATRMLGEVVEHGFEVKPGATVKVGQTIGWVEGFKAMSDLYCVCDGSFSGGNPEIEADPTLTDSDPYGRGWLYAVRNATPEPNGMPVRKYMELLDMTIDKMQGKSGGESSSQ